MTENLAGRGEGLAGLVAEWRETANRGKQAAAYADTVLSRETIHARVHIYEKCVDELETALEAAAPAGTAPRDKMACWMAARDWCAHWTVSMAAVDSLAGMLMQFQCDALATPSPQAFPSWICNNCGRLEPGGMGKPTICGTCGWNNWKQHDSSTPAATQEPAGSDPRVQCMTCGAIFVEHARPCPKCGGKSIHHTVYNDHERTPATQEQPAGSGALTRERAEQVAGYLVRDCVMKWNASRDNRGMISDIADTLMQMPGSPRKVGEDGAIIECALRNAITKMEGWDSEMFDAEIAECKAALEVLARPSSVPVGEQKQEEGV